MSHNYQQHHDDDEEDAAPKRRRLDEQGGVLTTYDSGAGTTRNGIRTSTLPAPTLQLTGHSGSVYAVDYSPNGDTLLSTSFDMKCLLWDSRTRSSPNDDDDDEEDYVGVRGYTGDGDETGNYTNFNVLEGHKNAVLDCCWLGTTNTNATSDQVVTCGADKTCMLWDVLTGQRIRKFSAQDSGIVNACCAYRSPNTAEGQLFASVSDDGVARLWDIRTKHVPVVELYDDKSRSNATGPSYPLLAVATASDSGTIFTAGIDNGIHAWEIKHGAKDTSRGSKSGRRLYSMMGHTDSITCLAMNTDNTHLLSVSMDHTLQSWDVRPFVTDAKGGASKHRHDKTFVGFKHNQFSGMLKCAWSSDGNMVTCGSNDRNVHIWDTYSTQELYVLPGHKGCVNAVAFHPRENIVVSGSSDKSIFVGELS